MPRKTKALDLAELVWLYGDEGVARTILDHATEVGTVERIKSGELSLPAPHDALEFHLAKTVGEYPTKEQAEHAKALRAAVR